MLISKDACSMVKIVLSLYLRMLIVYSEDYTVLICLDAKLYSVDIIGC